MTCTHGILPWRPNGHPKHVLKLDSGSSHKNLHILCFLHLTKWQLLPSSSLTEMPGVSFDFSFFLQQELHKVTGLCWLYPSSKCKFQQLLTTGLLILYPSQYHFSPEFCRKPFNRVLYPLLFLDITPRLILSKQVSSCNSSVRIHNINLHFSQHQCPFKNLCSTHSPPLTNRTLSFTSPTH